MQKYFQIKAVLFLLGQTGHIVFGQDDFGNENARGEYLKVFSNVPTLFEYLLDTLEENPEILEKNNAEFKAADNDVSNDVTRFQRSVNNDEKKYKSIEEGIIQEEEENRSYEESNENKEDNGKVTNTEHNKRDANDKMVSKRNINAHFDQTKKGVYANENKILGKGDGISHTKVYKRNINDIKVLKRNEDDHEIVEVNQSLDDSEEENSDEVDDRQDVKSLDDDAVDRNGEDDDNSSDEGNDEEAFQSLNDHALFRLTSEEIAEQALKVEEMLEQHNSSR